MSKHFDLAKEISRIRNLRLSQEVSVAKSEYLKLLQTLGLSRQNFNFSLKNTKELGCSLRSRLAALEASFLRREDKTSIALALLDDEEIEPQFDPFFQQGLNFYGLDQKQKALRYFKSALSYAVDEYETLFCLFNILCCLEDLGIDYISYLKQFEESWRLAPEDVKRSLQDPYDAFIGRVSFRNIDIQPILEMSAKPTLSDQSLYFCAYVLRLKALRDAKFSLIADKTLEIYASRQTTQDKYAFEDQLSTLLFKPQTFSETKKLRCHHFAERLYLWVWKWLCTNDLATLKQVRQLLEVLTTAKFSFSVDDKQQVRCALEWLRTFGLSESHCMDLFPDFTTSFALENFFPVYREELEFIFSYRLGAREDSIAQDLRSIFPIQATAKVSPVPLRKDTGRCLTVDLLTSLIADTEKIVNVQSREFASVFQGFNASESMPSSDFVKLVWGFSSFNPERHLDRMKSFFRKFNSEFDGWARLGIRDGKVLLKLQNVRVDLVHATQHVLDVARVFAGVGLDTQFEHSASTPTTAKRSADLTAPTTKGSSWSRVDFQNYWGLSKTSTVLRIQNHLKAGAIERKGVGKSSVYSVLDPVVFEI